MKRIRKSFIVVIIAAAFVLAVGGFAFYYYGRSVWVPAMTKIKGKRTVAEAVEQYRPAAEKRLAPYFAEAGLLYPPTKITLIGLKDEKRLEVWAETDGQWIHVRDYEVKRASGTAGPKLREGDKQVPEGIYQIEGLNPNSSYHLSLKVNYPNEFDQQQAVIDGRTQLGGDIFIHGKNVSIGCLAMGDEAIEELFVLVDRVGRENVSILIAPQDLRTRPWSKENTLPWLDELYAELTEHLRPFKR